MMEHHELRYQLIRYPRNLHKLCKDSRLVNHRGALHSETCPSLTLDRALGERRSIARDLGDRRAKEGDSR